MVSLCFLLSRWEGPLSWPPALSRPLELPPPPPPPMECAAKLLSSCCAQLRSPADRQDRSQHHLCSAPAHETTMLHSIEPGREVQHWLPLGHWLPLDRMVSCKSNLLPSCV